VQQSICEKYGSYDSNAAVVQIPSKSSNDLKEALLVLVAAVTTCAALALWRHLRRLGGFRILSPAVRSLLCARLPFV
jgi:hypothetical protein